MTFYEAALRVLEAAGRPLHFQEITERSIQQNLLSHIGKTPELTMLSRLLAMARRKTDRKVVVTAKDMFALVDWALPEEPDALAETAKSEVREEDNLPPLRPTERHPEPRADNVRIAGRGADRKRRRDEDDGKRRKKRFPPISEVVFEILSDEGRALKPSALVERAHERELAPEDVGDQQILTALLEDNQRRIDAGRRPLFVYDQATGEVSLERAGAATEAPPVELQAAFAAALGIPMEGGRPVLPRAAAAAPAGAPAQVSEELVAANTALKTAAKDARRAAARALRRRLTEVDAGAFEKAMVKVLHAHGFRELKVAKRSKEGPLLTARKREGSLELRWAIRLLKGGNAVDRKAVQELRRDVGHYSAQIALLVSAGEVRGDAKSEATGQGALVFVWGGDALADKFLEAEVGVSVARIESYEIDDRFFEAVRLEAEEAQRRREERMKDKQQRRGEDRGGEDEERAPREPRPPREPREPRAPREELAAGGAEGQAEARPAEEPARAESPEPGAASEERPRAEQVAHAAADAELGEADEEGEGEDGDEDLDEAEAFVAGGRPEGAEGAAPGAPGQPQGERRRRRRRRRGRRGRGNRPEGGAQAGGQPGGGAQGPGGQGGAANAEAGGSGGGASAAGGSANAGGGNGGGGGSGGGGGHGGGGDAPAPARETPPPAPSSSGAGEGSAG